MSFTFLAPSTFKITFLMLNWPSPFPKGPCWLPRLALTRSLPSSLVLTSLIPKAVLWKKLSLCVLLYLKTRVQFNSVQSLSHVRLFVTPWTAVQQASLFITNSRSLLKLMSAELMMSFNHLICLPLLLLPSTLPSIRVFSNESVLHIRWTKFWSFKFSISPSNEYSGLISLR